MTFVILDGVRHHVEAEGTGPPCVLTAGLGLTGSAWNPVVPLLTAHRTVIRFDRPGLGLSAPAPTWPTLAQEAHRIARLLDALDLPAPTPVTVAGHSLAGFHAEAFARLHPSRTGALVLIESSVEQNPHPRRAGAARNTCTRACAGLLRTAGAPRSWPATLAEYATYRDEAVDLARLRERCPLPDIPIRVLATGSKRWLSRQRALAETLNGTFHPITDGRAGHLPMRNCPQEVAHALLVPNRQVNGADRSRRTPRQETPPR
ncbi:alpha/beta fold hydrolase [Streptomyces sp. NPDC059786]|uniref:alpha/beta fold hydrolase n=1 Tax=Streptomyces sp. NPDC059786 TaxID=3346946 RepID=UPI00365396EE